MAANLIENIYNYVTASQRLNIKKKKNVYIPTSMIRYLNNCLSTQFEIDKKL